jgi:hypothetical protein
MANPRVRPHLRFYPEDNGKSVNEYYQAEHWRENICPDDQTIPPKLTPMAVIGNQQFFLYEPCLLHDGRACMPYEWFYRDKRLYAKTWSLRSALTATGLGWIVEEFSETTVPEEQFLVSFGAWSSSHATRHLPPATNIFGVSLTFMASRSCTNGCPIFRTSK